MLRFLLNLSITPLPAEELYELYLRFIPNYVCHLLACTPEEIYVNFISKVESCVSSPFSKIGVKFRTKFVIRILL